jgi:hypothetical protein
MAKKQKPLVTTQQSNASTTVDPMVSDMQRFTLGHAQSILNPYLTGGAGYGVAERTGAQDDALEAVKRFAYANGGGGVTADDITAQINPYRKEVVDVATSGIQRDTDRALAQIRGRRAAGSAFGGVGARAALESAETRAAGTRQIAETTAQLMAQGYDRATATAIANKELQSNALKMVTGAVDAEQEQRQRELDAPLRALQLAHNVTPQQYSSSSTGTQTTTAPNTAPTPLQQMLGLGLSVFGGPIGNAANRLFA